MQAKLDAIEMLPSMEMFFRHIEASYLNTYQWQSIEGIGEVYIRGRGML